MRASLSVIPGQYPEPPPRIAITDDLETMRQRYLGHLRGDEPLAALAYYIATAVEAIAYRGPGASHASRQQAVIDKYRISRDVLVKIRNLSSEAGGSYARKANGAVRPLTSNETSFLRETIKRIILRIAEWEHDRHRDFEDLRLDDLPPL